IPEWIKGPAQPRVRTERFGLRVVLHEARELEIRRDIEAKARADQVLGEVAFGEPPHVVFAGKLHDDERGGLPCTRQLVLVEPPVVEPAKPPRSLGAESTLGGEPALETEAVEAIRARGNGNAVSDLKWREKSLTSRNEIELEAIAALETAVDRRHEIAVALPTA